MLNKKYFAKIKQILLEYAEKRRELIKLSGDAQHLAKRAIFALQRDESDKAGELLRETKIIFQRLKEKYTEDKRLFGEGSYRAALEEYVEAFQFRQCLNDQPLDQITDLEVEEGVFIGGLADVPGELVRYAVKSATERKFDVAERCCKQAEEIIGALIEMNLTGYNRQKFDQAKQSVRKLEQLVYEISMKK